MLFLFWRGKYLKLCLFACENFKIFMALIRSNKEFIYEMLTSTCTFPIIVTLDILNTR